MSKTTPAPPVQDPNAFPSADRFKDQAAIQRALDHYLLGPTPSSPNTLRQPNAKPSRSLEESLVHVSELLTCAAATAYESGDGLSGSKRALAFSAMHLVEMAKAELDQSLDKLPLH
ncbi:DUF3077 domain-containing protein [Pseudomonas batumici]|uniref:DUF6124 family protein n=1 Tax=Pseudomonas batumici TaxID=226910 RepID=UPI0030CA8A0A